MKVISLDSFENNSLSVEEANKILSDLYADLNSRYSVDLYNCFEDESSPAYKFVNLLTNIPDNGVEESKLYMMFLYLYKTLKISLSDLLEYLDENGYSHENLKEWLENNAYYISGLKVTEFYNSVTCNPLNNPEDWWIISDCDEFQVWRDEPKNVVEEAKKLNCTFITGGFLDRIGENGTFPEIKGPEDDLDKLFPLVGFFRYPLSKACPNKVVAVKSGQKVCSGQHYAVFPDGTNSWGSKDPRGYYKAKTITLHFKWDSTVLDRLKETARSGCSYSEEYQRMYDAIKDNNFRIPVENPEFMIEQWNPEKGYYSYTHWNKVFKLIQTI